MKEKESEEVCPKCDDRFFTKNDVLNHMIEKHVQSDSNVTSQSSTRPPILFETKTKTCLDF